MRSSLKLPYIMGGAKRAIRDAVVEKIESFSKLLNLISDLFNEEVQQE
jgi:hypothetical protein